MKPLAMIQGARAIVIPVGILFALSAVSATEWTMSRHDPEIQQFAPGDEANSARNVCAKRCKSARVAVKHKKLSRRAEMRLARQKASQQKLARRAKSRQASVYDTGRPGARPKGGVYTLGTPYVMRGRKYVPKADPNYRAEGQASWYGKGFHGHRTANGEKFDMYALTAAHPTLPLPSYVRVTNLENQRSLVVRLNDRGPYHGRRLIDVSVRAAKMLGFYDRGIAQVRVEYVGRADLAAIQGQEESAAVKVATLPFQSGNPVRETKSFTRRSAQR